jgi:acyl-CoA synthetase (AMP-forming)/AMP-acid ligase II
VGQPGPSLVILGDDGTPLPPDTTGEIAIEGRRAIGYLGEPVRLTAGWFRTGDAGHLDADGFLFITGRIKELINRGGEKISPHEIDAVLLTHPGVASALAFGMPAPTVGEEVAAAVVLRPGAQASEAELREYVAARLASFKVPRRIALVDALPTGSTGKLRRSDLASLLRLS